MNEEILKLYKTREKLFKDMLDCVQRANFKYTEDEVDAFGNFVRNLSVHTRVIRKNQDEINKFNKNEYGTDKEVCEIEKRCKALAKKIYDIDKEVNDKMSEVLGDIRKKYVSSKNQQKYYSYSNNINYISESFASFDMKQ
jgi:ParB-like chromosome segregation protein Spo0J